MEQEQGGEETRRRESAGERERSAGMSGEPGGRNPSSGLLAGGVDVGSGVVG
jgi:hypothetical protein